MKILGIETSCDETGVAIYDSEKGLLANILYSQVPMHAVYGGVVPELASRDHVRKLTPLVKEACAESGLALSDLDGIAYTFGPGLMGALLTGAAFARSLAYGLGVPCLGVHHLEAHIMAAMLEGNAPSYPYIALLVSGGHTQFLQVNGLGEYQLLGETLDDAVGEAFDKTAKLLGLEYPGGPKLAALAEQGTAHRFRFPRPMTDRPGLSLSFSGLKTFARNTWQNSAQTAQDKADIALAFEQAVCETLSIKCKRAIKQTGIKRLVVAGGVSANQQLRISLGQLLAAMDGELFFPALEYCTDNGAMVAYLGCLRMMRGEQQTDLSIEAIARKPL